MIIAADTPKMFKYSMIDMFYNPNLFLIKVPKLLKTAVERLAESPIIAIYFPESP